MRFHMEQLQRSEVCFRGEWDSASPSGAEAKHLTFPETLTGLQTVQIYDGR